MANKLGRTTPGVEEKDVLSILEGCNKYVTANFIAGSLRKKKKFKPEKIKTSMYAYDWKISDWYLTIKIKKTLDTLYKEDKIEKIELLNAGVFYGKRNSSFAGYKLKEENKMIYLWP